MILYDWQKGGTFSFYNKSVGKVPTLAKVYVIGS